MTVISGRDLEDSNQNILHCTPAHDHHTKFSCKSYSGSEDTVRLDIVDKVMQQQHPHPLSLLQLEGV